MIHALKIRTVRVVIGRLSLGIVCVNALFVSVSSF